jgi:acyl carrier protein
MEQLVSEPVVSLELAIATAREVLPRKHRDRFALGPDTRLEEELGFSSLDVSDLFMKLEAKLGVRLDTSQIAATKTIGDLLGVRLASEDRAW